MPTKRNRAGNQQNYVPKGNGDASGEYGDNATGSNKHFTNFKQPDEQKSFEKFSKTNDVAEVKAETQAEQPKEDTSKFLGGSKEKSELSSSLQSMGFGIYGQEAVDKMKEIITNANEECIAIVNYCFMNHKVQFTEGKYGKGSYYAPLLGQIHINPEEIERTSSTPGTTVFHEIGHYINNTNKIKEKEQWFDQYKMLTDARTLFEDNKSVAETLQEDLDNFSAQKYAPKIRKEKEKFMNEKLAEHGFTLKEYETKLEKSKQIFKTDEEWLGIRSKIQDDFDNGRYTLEEANKVLDQARITWKKNGKYKEFYEQLDKQRPLVVKAFGEWGKKTGIEAVSDAWSSRSDFGFGYGHERSYYNKSRTNEHPESLIADELFANFFGALTTNNTAVLETTKKYLPNTYDKMVKLVEHLKGKKQNYDKMGEEIKKFQEGGE